MIKHQIKVLQSLGASLLQAGRGVTGTPHPKQPALPLQLYEFEGSPFCRRVREVLTLLNLDYEVYPCPKKGTRYRPTVQALGGKLQFPFFIDQNTNQQLYESQKIIDYLFAHYGKTGRTPKKYQHYPAIPVVGVAVTLANMARGTFAQPQNAKRAAPEQLLELWGFDASPFTRLVRCTLSELELPFVFHNVAKERWQDMGLATRRFKSGPYVPLAGGKRETVLARMGGKIQVPYLEDPNTGAQLFESEQIITYLKQTYADELS